MRVLEIISTLELKRLAALEVNARRWAVAGTDKQKVDAECVLLAISAERKRRQVAADEQAEWRASEVANRVRNKDLFSRVLLAFSEMPPEQWEAEVLREIASRPDQHFDAIAKAIGKRAGSYVNLAVGTLCSCREVYLGQAPAAKKKKGEKVYSALIIDFIPHKEPSGSEWHGWTLKPEAHAALRQLEIVK